MSAAYGLDWMWVIFVYCCSGQVRSRLISVSVLLRENVRVCHCVTQLHYLLYPVLGVQVSLLIKINCSGLRHMRKFSLVL